MNVQNLQTIKRLRGELLELNKNPLSTFGITVGLYNENNFFEWKITLFGPKDTPYRGGLFYLKAIFPQDYPIGKPEILFITPIYHLNVKYFAHGIIPLGHICLSSLLKWKPENTMNKILPEIFYLLYNNNPDSPYDEHGRRNEFLCNRPLFDKKAREFTKKYANVNKGYVEYKTDWNFSYPF